MFKSWFAKPAEDIDVPEADADLSLGALLVRMAKADNEYHVAEITMVDRILASQFNLNTIDAAKMRATCETLEKLAPDTERFVELIRDNVGLAQRRALMVALVDVAKADGVDHPEEMALFLKLDDAIIGSSR